MEQKGSKHPPGSSRAPFSAVSPRLAPFPGFLGGAGGEEPVGCFLEESIGDVSRCVNPKAWSAPFPAAASRGFRRRLQNASTCRWTGLYRGGTQQNPLAVYRTPELYTSPIALTFISGPPAGTGERQKTLVSPECVWRVGGDVLILLFSHTSISQFCPKPSVLICCHPK